MCRFMKAGPLLKLTPPLLFITTSHDKFCKIDELKALAERMPSTDARLMVIEVSGSWVLCVVHLLQHH